MAVARCSQGHEWEVSVAPTGQTDPVRLACPYCGEQNADTLVKMPGPASTRTAEWLPPGFDSVPILADDPDVTRRDTSALVQTKPESRPASSAYPELPGYEILELCGQGGMGVVYRARQTALDRVVALKMIHGITAPAPEALARFRTEAQAVARLRHPGIVQIFDIGTHEGRPYFTLEYVEGGNLSVWLKRSGFSPRQAAQLVESLARAVQHAHEQGIIHRDLKPGNILLTREGIPKITDFGLAKRLENASGSEKDAAALTRTGEVLGTPSFMAPEQAAGLHSQIGPPTDVYALGAILYQLLVGRPPFEGDNPVHTMMRVMEEEPIAPQKIQPKVPRDLQTICLKCLEKMPSRRYPSAAALADELRAFLAGEPVRARPIGMRERVERWVRRRPLVAAGVGLGVLISVGLLVGAFFYSAAVVAVLVALSVAVVGLWYSVRLRAALRRNREQHLALERTVERLHLIMETTQRLMKADNLEDLLRLLTEATTQLVNAERATIYLVDDAKGELWSRVAMGDDVGEIRVSLGSGIAGTVAKTGAVINIPDPYADPRFNPDIDKRTGYRTTNLLTLPMRGSDGRTIGVFQVLNKRVGAFDSDDVELLQALAGCAAAIVNKAK